MAALDTKWDERLQVLFTAQTRAMADVKATCCPRLGLDVLAQKDIRNERQVEHTLGGIPASMHHAFILGTPYKGSLFFQKPVCRRPPSSWKLVATLMQGPLLFPINPLALTAKATKPRSLDPKPWIGRYPPLPGHRAGLGLKV